jgi:hypothetical protein
MQKFYPRWTANERRAQAYVTLPDYEKLLKEQNDAGGAPQIVTITIPHSYATIATMVTYWLHTFAGRSPMFPVRSHQGEKVKNALSMEILLQYNADHTDSSNGCIIGCRMRPFMGSALCVRSLLQRMRFGR